MGTEKGAAWFMCCGLIHVRWEGEIIESSDDGINKTKPKSSILTAEMKFLAKSMV